MKPGESIDQAPSMPLRNLRTCRTQVGLRSLIPGAACLLILAHVTGCGQAPPATVPPPFEGVELEVAAMGDPALLEAIRVQTGEWERETGARLNIRTDAVDLAGAATADLILFPGEQLGTLVDAGLLTRISESAIRPTTIFNSTAQTENPTKERNPDDSEGTAKRDPLDFSDVVLPFREQVTKYGDERMALPLGGSTLVLAYRRDAFRAEANQQAAKEANLELEAPTTWEQLDALAKFFQGRDWNGDGQPDHGIALALGTDADRLGTDTFLAWAATLGQPPDQYALLFDPETLEPRIASPPFVEALEAMARWKELGPPEMADFNADAARAAFREGRTALLIDRPERAQFWTDPQKPVDVAVSPLPASTRVYDPSRKTWITPRVPNRLGFLRRGGGWLGGINARSSARKADAALALLIQLASPEIAQEIVSDPAFPMAPVRTSNLALGLPDPRAAVGVDSRGWGQAVLDTYSAPRTVIGLRIPDSYAYMTDLEKARLAVIHGEPAEPALKNAAESWRNRSVSLGKDRQLWHYRRSLNKLSTTAQPPPPPAAR